MKITIKLLDLIQPKLLGSFSLLLAISSFAGQNAFAQESSQNPKKEINNKHVKIVIYDKDESINPEEGGANNLNVTKSLDTNEYQQEIGKSQLGDVQESIEITEVQTNNSNSEIEVEEIIIDEDVDDSKPKLVEQSWFVMDIGMNTWLTQKGEDLPEFFDPLELNTAKSINFHLGIIQQGLNLYKGKLRLVYGLGVEFNNYRFKKNVDLTPDAKTLTFELNSTTNYAKNKLVSQYATIPLMLNFKSNPKDEDESFNLAAGVQLGYLIGSHTKQKWEDGGRKEKSKQKGDYNFQDYRLGYVLQFGYGDFNLIAKYYPTTVFAKNQGPVVNTASVGLVISPF